MRTAVKYQNSCTVTLNYLVFVSSKFLSGLTFVGERIDNTESIDCVWVFHIE